MKKTFNVFLTIFLSLQFMLPILMGWMTVNVQAQEQTSSSTEITSDTQSKIESSEKNETQESQLTSTDKTITESATNPPEKASSIAEEETASNASSVSLSSESSSSSEESESRESESEKESSSSKEEQQSVTLTYEIEGITVEVSGEPGVLPEDASLKVEPVADEHADKLLNEIEEKKDVSFSSVGLLDITIFDKDGNEIQPKGEVKVNIKGLNFIKNDDKTQVYHVDEENKQIETFKSQSENEKITFETTHFSIYVVGTNLRDKVNDADQPYKLAIGDTITLYNGEMNTSDWTFSGTGSVSFQNSNRTTTLKGEKEGLVEVEHKERRWSFPLNFWWEKDYFYIQVVPDTIDTIKNPVPPKNDENAGQVNASKTAKWADYSKRIAEINLDVHGNATKSGSDIILIMDTSGSMKDNQRMTNAQSASQTFIQSILGNGNEYGNRVAYIPFSYGTTGGGAGTIEVASATAGSHNFTDDASTLSSYVNRSVATGGTNYTAALQKALDFANSRSADQKDRPLQVVFMSDGTPGAYGTSANDTNWNGVNQANALKSAGATIHTLGIQVSGDAPQALKNISSGDAYYHNVSNVANLDSVLQDVASEIHLAGTDAAFTDYISDEFEYYSDGQYVSDGTYNSVDRSMKIDVGNITQETKNYKIYVQMKDEHWLKDGTFQTNKDVYLDYKDVNNQQVRKPVEEIGSPSLQVTNGTIGIRYSLVDKQGNYINTDGKIVDSQNKVYVPSQDAMTYHLENGSQYLEVYGNPTYQVQANPPSDYQLYSGENSQKAVTLTTDQKHQQVEFKVVIPDPDPINFNFKLVDGNGQDLTGASFTLEKVADDGTTTTIENVTTNSLFTYNGLTEGRYSLTENQVPNGYRLPLNNTWSFNVVKQPGNTLQIEFVGEGLETDPDNANQYIVTNYLQGEFPQTGGPGSLGFMVIGLLIVTISLGIYYKNNIIIG